MTPPQNTGLHRFAVFTACCTLLLLVAGALVTSNDAGLAVPDWPLSYGSIAPPMVGGIFYEHSHRVVATFVGVLTIVLTVWLWRRDPRPWVRWIGFAALGTVVVQGILGGLTVLFYLPRPISIAHASLGQLFFCSLVSLALFTSRWWQNELPQVDDSGSPRLRGLAVWTVAAVFLQLVLGAALRHKAMGIVPHLAGAVMVTILVFHTARVLKRRHRGLPVLGLCGRLLRVLVMVQLLLGGAAYWSCLFATDFPQPVAVTVWLTVAHTVVGAVMLAVAVVMVLVCFRVLKPARGLAFARGHQAGRLVRNL